MAKTSSCGLTIFTCSQTQAGTARVSLVVESQPAGGKHAPAPDCVKHACKWQRHDGCAASGAHPSFCQCLPHHVPGLWTCGAIEGPACLESFPVVPASSRLSVRNHSGARRLPARRGFLLVLHSWTARRRCVAAVLQQLLLGQVVGACCMPAQEGRGAG